MVRLSIVLPAFQEAERIGVTLADIRSFLQTVTYQCEVIVVDDGSTDRTVEVVANATKTFPELRLLRHGRNCGKGAAVRTGMAAAIGLAALFTDADNSTPIREVEKLLPEVERGADIAIGSRYLPRSNVVVKQPPTRVMVSRIGNLLFRLLLGLPYTDTRCGFKLYSKRARETVFPRQTLERWGFDTELLVIARLHGLRVVEVPVEWHDRRRGNIRVARDSLLSFQELLHIRSNMRKGIYA